MSTKSPPPANPGKTKSPTKEHSKLQSVAPIRLKTVVRRLPPNLPEPVFWQSVQPWVTDETASWKIFYQGKLRKKYACFLFVYVSLAYLLPIHGADLTRRIFPRAPTCCSSTRRIWRRSVETMTAMCFGISKVREHLSKCYSYGAMNFDFRCRVASCCGICIESKGASGEKESRF